MRLKKLKVAGFKSFVDPTNIVVPADLVGIVGPNGCGKSNVIDAVRWVMGESSAKNLRGDAMADVIFNGSVSRKPVGKASVELLFQNDGEKIPESYANFSEISIKRTLTRDGKSDYFINNTRARRKDIQDIFRGTGLGPRSYSIIEQGMVSRIIESKPEDLRSFVEEAAGISKYKDRRRETENRIRHTRENLERVDDIIQELDKQLRRLQRQSQVARRYKNLKQDEHELQGQLFLMRKLNLVELSDQQDRQLAECEIMVQKNIADQRALEQQLEQTRVEIAEAQEAFGKIQAGYYEIGAEISNLEQRIEHERETRRRQQMDLERLTEDLEKLDDENREDLRQSEEIRAQIAELDEHRSRKNRELQMAEASFEESREEANSARRNHEDLVQRATIPARQVEVQKSVIVQSEQQKANLQTRLDRLTAEQQEISTQAQESQPDQLRSEVLAHDAIVKQMTEQLRQTEAAIQNLRRELDQARQKAESVKTQKHALSARLHSLKEIQASALGADDEEFQRWMENHGLVGERQLATIIRVQERWRRAADAVLTPFLKAIVTARSLESMDLANATDLDLTVVSSDHPRVDSLGEKYLTHWIESSDVELNHLFGHIRVAETAEQAFSQRHTLSNGELIVTADGIVIGRNWVQVPGSSRDHGILAREQELEGLARQLETIEAREREIDGDLDRLREQRNQLEGRRNQNSQQLGQANREHADMQNRLGQQEARFQQLQSRMGRVTNERAEAEAELARSGQRISEAHDSMSQAQTEVTEIQSRLAEAMEQRERSSAEFESRQATLEGIKSARYDLDTRWQVLSSNLQSVEAATERLRSRRMGLERQSEALNEALAMGGAPEERLKQDLSNRLNAKGDVENRMNQARQQIDRLEQTIRETQARHGESEKDVEIARDRLSRQQLTNQETRIKITNLDEQIENGGHDLKAVAEQLPKEADESEWREKLEAVTNKISNIGPVNLVAIEEFEEQSERKTYLDQQHADLTQSLETLESVIRKIDRETRTRFKDTFDQLNQGFQTFFPQLFGGGSAVLELTDDDYLTTGVTVMARPPGKRNSTIHLLSGGEKALTAVSLLFSLFKLNPAPFCLLDEVDAPLDDANVERYCETLKTLAEHTQLLVITHNKITMEATQMLVGVTMGEPGVSKMVAVDVDEAVKMVAQ